MATRKSASATDDEKKVENDRKAPARKSTAKDSSAKKSDAKGARSRSAASTPSAKTRVRAAQAGSAKSAQKSRDIPDGKKSADESTSAKSPAEPSKTRSADAENETSATETPGPPPEPSQANETSATESSSPEFPQSASPLSPPPANVEENKSLVSYLALWGPLIIVGFLVIVFHGDQPQQESAEIGALSEPEPITATAFVEPSPSSLADNGSMPPASHRDMAGDTVASVPEPRRTSDLHGSASSSSMATGYEPPRGYPPPLGPYIDPRGSQRHDPWMILEDRHIEDRYFEPGSRSEPFMSQGEDGGRLPYQTPP
ncbi:hypothetical protein [Thioalkalivibrio sp. HK1]|uniref:hypothetical protein n=1 Tax=Thioalkalivibrio sp. HK1 TaxID=1469245 RepID=UPI00047259DE|nr:hypothetical protein [Thioalkalivibrio sp. HK1]